jgi:hypothetical protein
MQGSRGKVFSSSSGADMEGKFASQTFQLRHYFSSCKDSHFQPILAFASSLLLHYFFLSIEISFVP